MGKPISVLLISVLSFAFLSCGKAEEPVPAPDPARLKVEIREVLTNAQHKALPKAKIQLYKSEADWTAKTNAVKDVVTDNYGNYTFTDLEPVNYLFRAQSADGTKTNNKTGNQTGVLKSNETKELEVILRTE